MITRVFTTLILAVISFSAQAQNLWNDVENETILTVKESDRQIIPNKYRLLSLDFPGISKALSVAPKWQPGVEAENSMILELPTPDKGMQRFKVVEASIFAQALAAKYPKIKSYKGWGIDDPTATLRFDISPQGFHAMVISAHGSWFIDPYSKADTKYYMSYDKKDFDSDTPFLCGVEGSKLAQKLPDLPEYGDSQFRTYRLALACTGEYAQFHGGTVAGALAAMNTTMVRVNGVYEREFAITMVLVDNNDQLVFLNGNTDPYTNNDGNTMLDENQTTVDDIIGFPNYDIGHVFSTGGGGIAALHSPCTGIKAEGVTGRAAPVGDPFDIDYVAHEMGHQFGANHTQNNDCNRNASTAMEPGSASTIMGYAGICFPNVQSHSDDYFHTISLQEIHANITLGSGSGCPTTVQLNNQKPTVVAGADYTIPVSTPFVLDAVGADNDNDPITYCWEQMDAEVGDMPPQATSNLGPLFRSISPTVDSKRYFPALSAIIANTTPEWEVLPSVSRTMKFRVTVRDNHPGGGCNETDDVVITASANAGPFVVTQPNTAVNWFAQSDQTITWDVANTHLAPVNAATVDIFLSLDGGHTYPITLATNTPNDGSQVVTLPAQTSTTARIMVKGHNNVFFDISNTNFTISTAQPGFTVVLSQDSVSMCAPATQSMTLSFASIAGFTGNVTIATSNVPAGMTISASPQTVAVPGTSNVVITANASLSGSYEVFFDVTGSTGTVSRALNVFVANGMPSMANLLFPADGETGIEIQPTLKWAPANNAASYLVEVFAEANLTNLVESKTVSDVDSITLSTALNPDTQYFWRVTTMNACGNVVSNVFSFTTQAIFCQAFSATDLPITISATAATTITSTLHIDVSGELKSIKVTNLDIKHSWIQDLKVKLTAPDGTEVKLFDQICTGGDSDILINFDDDVDNTYASIPCPPTGNETYQPLGQLNSLLGKNVTGDWVLTVEDVYGADGGSLNAWSLDLCYLVDSLTMQVNTTDVACFGGNDGSATVVVAGGKSPYTYTWSSGNGTNLSAGNYSVTVTDANGQTASTTFVINQPDEIVLTASITDASTGASDGMIDLSVSGGTPSYTYNWSNGKTTQDIANLSANTYQVTVTDAHDCSMMKSFVVEESCGIPTQISSEILSSNSVTISWAVVAGADSYQIRYRVVGATSWLSQTVTTNTVTLTGLTPDSNYEYQLQGHCASGWSSYSVLDNFTLPAPCDMPINVETVAVTSNSATLSWDVVAGASGYVTNYRKLGTTPWFAQSTTTNTITLTGLEASTSYEFIVKTECGNFSSNFNSAFVFTTMMACSPPTNIVATNLSYTSFKLDWDAISGVNQFSVRYRVAGTTDWSSANVSTETVTLNDLDAGATYEYQIQSKCGVAWSDFSELAQNTLPSGCALTGLTTGEITPNSIGLEWDATSGATKYQISYVLAGSGDTPLEEEVTATTTTISGLTANSVYAIDVRAYCEFGWGAKSTVLDVQTSPDGIFDVNSAHRFLLYPNPVASSLTLEFGVKPSVIVVYDVLGQEILSEKAALKMELDVSDIKTGFYFVRAIFDDGTETSMKFLKD